jgi:hypothetical protein
MRWSWPAFSHGYFSARCYVIVQNQTSKNTEERIGIKLLPSESKTTSINYYIFLLSICWYSSYLLLCILRIWPTGQFHSELTSESMDPILDILGIVPSQSIHLQQGIKLGHISMPRAASVHTNRESVR